jgi:hypothetical protein
VFGIFASHNIILEPIHNEYTGRVIVVDLAARFIDCHQVKVQAKIERSKAKVKPTLFSTCQTYGREVSSVLSHGNVAESYTQKFVVSKKRNLPIRQINQAPDYISYSPMFSVVFLSPIPFFNSLAIVSVRCGIVPHTITPQEWSFNS